MPEDDTTGLLSNLPTVGQDDYALRVVELYESAERPYREAMSMSNPVGTFRSSNMVPDIAQTAGNGC